MRQPDPKATELQQFGIVGVIFGAAAAIGILYAIGKTVGWL